MIAILSIVALLLLLVQIANGYALCETKLYTPSFTYWLVAGLVVAGWAAIAVYLASK